MTKRCAVMLLACAPLMGGAGTFPCLTPSDLQGRKLYAGELNQWNFEEEAPLVTAYAPTGFFQPVLRDALRRMGAEVFVRVAFDPSDTPDFFRLRTGFRAAIRFDCDGLYLPDGDKLPESYAKALGFARDDRQVAARLLGLIERGRDGKDLIVAAESRRARQWLSDLDGREDLSADDLRLEFGAWIRRLEAVLGEVHGPAPKALGSIGFRPDYEIPKTLGEVPVKVGGNAVPLDAEGRVCFSCDARGFSLSVATNVPSCRVSLTMNTGAHPRFRYDVRLGAEPTPPAPKDLPPRASFPARDLMNGVEPHFLAPPDWKVEPHEAYARGYPDPSFAWSRRTLTGSFAAFGDRAPMCVPRRTCRWRVTVESAGTVVCDAVLVWPAGSESAARRVREALVGNEPIVKVWQGTVDGLFARYCTSQLEKGFRFVPVKERCFEIGDVESDDLFWHAYAKRFWQQRPTPERLRTLKADVADARREFLAAAYAGGPFRERIADKEKSAVETATSPDADLGAGDALSLEDE